MKQSSKSTIPATVAIATFALALGSVGSAVAGPALTKSRVKAIAAKVVDKQAPSLSVASAAAVKDGAVTGATVADRSLSAADLAVGVVPADGFILQAMDAPQNPVAAPDLPQLGTRPVTLPRAGTTHVRLFGARFGATCSAGVAVVGLYVDGSPVPGTARNLPGVGQEPVELLGSLPLAEGAHQLAYGVDCATGGAPTGTFLDTSWTVLLAAD